MEPEWTTACPDWEERIINRESIIPTPPLFIDEAVSALEIFKALRVVDLPGSPTMGECCDSWILEFVAAVFGAYDEDEGRRLITEFFLCVAKKNAKSTIAAGIMLTALIRNWRHSAELTIIAPTLEVANNSYYPARDMVRADPELSALFHVQDYVRTIKHRVNGSSLKVLASDSDAVSGKKSAFVLVDELWLFGKQPNAENMLREACGGLASRPEGFVIYLTTQSDTTPTGIFRQKLQYARGVRDGKIDDKRFLPVIYEFPERMVLDKTYRKPENFDITNPNIGASVDVEFLKRELMKADEAGIESQSGFYAKHLNVQVSLALRSDHWSGAVFWPNCATPSFTLSDLIRESEVLTAGVDCGGLDDLLALCVMGREPVTGKWRSWVHAWVSKKVLTIHKQNAEHFRDFEREGTLTLVEEMGTDVEELAAMCAQCNNSCKLTQIGVDPAGAGTVLDALARHKIPSDMVVGIPQGWKMNGAIKTAERRLAEGSLTHGGQALMEWCVGNARVEPRGNAIVITRHASGAGKIDPLLATFNAVSLMSLNPKAPSRPQLLFF